jgi:ankyrin repeat protein
VELLIEHGADVNVADPVSATGTPHLAVLPSALTGALGLRCPIQDGLTALLAATSAGHTEIVKLLLERGANINSVDAQGVCSLFMACEAGDVPTVEALLGYNPDLFIREKVAHCTLT